MKWDLIYDFDVDIVSKTITIKKEYKADIQTLWQAWTTKEWLDKWWGPKPWHVETKTLDFIPNGIWHYAMVSPEGEKHWSLSQFISISPLSSFSSKDGFCDENGIISHEMPQSDWTVTFTSMNQNTLVTCVISYDDKQNLEKILEMGFKEGITMCLNQLEELIVDTTTER